MAMHLEARGTNGRVKSTVLAPTVPRELRTFVTGLKSDFDAVNAGLTTVWSNGRLEGQVNRLKRIKRQM